MTQIAVATEKSASDYARLARRRWKTIVIGLGVGIILAVAYLHFATPTYLSTAKVLVNPLPTDTIAANSRVPEGAVNLDTEAQIVQSTLVAADAKAILKSDLAPQALAQRVSVTVPPNSSVLDITYSASTAQNAQDGAAAFALAYQNQRQNTATDAIADQTTRLQGSRDAAKDQLKTINKQLQDPDLDAATRADLIAQRADLTVQISSANATLAQLQALVDPKTQEAVSKGASVITDANLPKKATSPNMLLVLPSGLIAGAILGLGVAALRNRVDKRIQSTSDIPRLFGLPVVAEASVGKVRSLIGSPVIAHEMRAVYHQLVGHEPDRSIVSLVVGTGSVAADQLAIVLAGASSRSGSRTALVLDNIDDDAFPGGRDGSRDLDVVDFTELKIVTSGDLRTPNIPAAVSELRQAHDFIVMGTPTNDWAVDLPALGYSVDVVIVVVEVGRSKRAVVNEILADLARTNVHDVVAVSIRAARDLPIREAGARSS